MDPSKSSGQLSELAKMAVGQHVVALALLLLTLITLQSCTAQVLTPPYFNLAVGKRIEATATCGEGVTEPELFCKLTGADLAGQDTVPPNYEVIQGQLCDVCNPAVPEQNHPPRQALDGRETWWQSPPLSRGLDFNRVNLTINLGQEFHVAYVFIKMANSPRPGVFALERSTDNGQTWKPWQYFADTLSDCKAFFGDEFETSITRDDSVLCSTHFSKVVPLEGGEIVVSLVNNRPSANNFSYATTLQEWTKCTNVRLRLLRTKTLLGHLMAVARQDPTVTRRYFYSIKDISLGGRCVCNGHAGSCDLLDLTDPLKLLCRCQHNTCGAHCEQCCPGFVQKPWQPATVDNINTCEPCNCHGHTTECVYDEEIAAKRLSLDIHGNYEGGGVCQKCQHNTAGINCEKCEPGYFRAPNVPIDSPYACQRCRCDLTYSTGECEERTGRCLCRPEYAGENCDRCNIGYFGYPRCIPCTCNVNGTAGEVCEVGGGQCPCKPNYAGNNCDQCGAGFYGFPDCQSCTCDSYGSLSPYCDPNEGQCRCRDNYGGRDCRECANGYYRYPTCQLCDCDPTGSAPEICDKNNGQCVCKPGFGGPRCDRCAPGFYRYPYCTECGCDSLGSARDVCDERGQCVCHPNYAGRICDSCATGYYRYPDCLNCNCDRYGSYDLSCDQVSGQCTCRSTFEGPTCDKCKPNYYNYPNCEECNCNPAGAKEVPGYPLGGCGAGVTGLLCECKDRVRGRNCETCKQGYWNLNINNPLGCEDCGCYKPGTVGGGRVCDTSSGDCVCKPFVSGRQCDQCLDGTYNLQDYNVFGCQDCECDNGGAMDHVCHKDSGQCHCRPRVQGRRCNRPLMNHFFPTLYQHMYEMENGRTESGGAVRYAFDSNIFPDFSWRGYAILSRLQEEVFVDVDIRMPSLYRLIFRYVNSNPTPITAEVTVTPETSSDVQQTSTVVFSPSNEPRFVTVSGSGVISTFVLNPGRWTISLKSPENLFVDYLVLLPQDYYEAGILQERVNRPCTVPFTDELCKHYVYVDLSAYTVVRGEAGYTRIGGTQDSTQVFPDQVVNEDLGVTDMAYLDRAQDNLILPLVIPQPGKYVLVIQYHSDVTGRNQDINVDVNTAGGNIQGVVSLPGCPYSSLCRQVVKNNKGNVKTFELDGSQVTITITGGPDLDLAIDSIIAIPHKEWSIEAITPKLKCLRMDKKCMESTFLVPTGSVRTDIESGINADRVATDIPPHIIDTNIRVIKIDGITPTVNVKASIITPGLYIFVVHYYQPYQSSFAVHVTVDIDGQMYHGKFDAKYCPGVSGCRAVVKFEDLNSNAISISGFDYAISFNNSHGHPIWLDYVLAVPQIQYESQVLDIQPVDTASVFVTKCGQNNYYVDTDTQGFCRDSIFSLTTDYNNGALSCECNSEGSLRFSCDEFGGQCNCRPDVIGRTCSECRTGFYGFPNCRPCNCPSGLCDPKSGQCVCPPRVTGPTCNVCLPRTFGYDRLIGCEECNCDPYGVMNNELDCDIDSGQCQCKPNVDGRSCDHCVTGHYSFPRCLACNCNFRGSTVEICDQSSGTCLCKENVEGPQCAQCKQSTFYLEERNPKGCTNCFCFGTTQSCSSSSYRRSEVRTLDGWGITNMRRPELSVTARSIEVFVEEQNLIDPNQALYWVAPEPYLRNKVTSYGGKLIYTVTFTLPRNQPSSGVVIPDVRIEGNNFTLVHTSPQQPVENVPLSVEIDLLETQFVHESTEAQATREQFMTLLANVESLQIRASYYSVVESVNLADVHMDIATLDGTGSLARNVEQCQCPPNYRGTSCEECAEGYYRTRTGGYLGVCVPCQCNNKADTCDPVTGECINCRDNFGGPQCLACKQGYYLDDYSGRCEICSCPLPMESNNFASTCEVYNGVLQRCICLPGYTGVRCDQCAPGYYGDPRVQGGSCQPCDCSGNIDLNDRYGCDPTTGQCLRCINNSEGPRCENCRSWYYGDAVDQKDCQPCNCDTYGTERCNQRVGSCICKPNVVGERCDQCAPGTFGFQRGQGCEPCSCGEGSITRDCDLNTGQCECQPGVQGRRCEECQPGYWNYGPYGCTKCQCEFEGATSCDSQTGQCVCRPGFTGPTCADCLDRWIFVPGVGCQECDNCVQLLIDDVEVMDHNTTVISKDLESVSAGVTAMRRLEKVNKTVHDYRPLVDAMLRSGGDPDENKILEPLQIEEEKMRNLADNVISRAQRVARESNVVREDAIDSRDDADELAYLIREGVAKANDAVRFAEEVLQDIINNLDNQNAQYLIQEAERILEDIRARDFFDQDEEWRIEYEAAEDSNRRATSLKDRTNENLDELERLQDFLDKVDEKFRDLMNSSRHSLDNSQAALDHNTRNQDDIRRITSNLEDVETMRKDASAMLTMARDQLSEAVQFLRDAEIAYSDVERESSRLDEARNRLRTFVDDFADENVQLRPEVDRATQHAEGLQREAQRLKDMIAGTTDSAAGAVNASNAYRAISESIHDAENASRIAVNNAQEAVQQSNGLADDARQSKERSETLKSQADNTKTVVTNELKPRLDAARDITDQLSDTNQRTEDTLTDFLISLNSLTNGYGDRAQQASDRAINAQLRAEEAQNKIQGILDKLPEDVTKVEQIPRDIEEANRDVQRAQTQVDNVLRLVPDATDLLDRLVSQSDKVNRIGVDLTQGITLLKERIARSREEASRLRIGVQFFPNTTLQVRNPQNLAQSGSYTKLSLFFKTVQSEGFLAYIGPKRPTGRVVSDDYFALEVVNRKATLKFDLGGGPAIVTVDKDVSDGEWHEVIAERTGKSATLTVRTHKEDDMTTTGESQGTFSVLDLNPATTKFFIGGIPSDAQLNDKLTSLRFEGCVEEVKFDGLPLGLWNFVEGENNYKSCMTRDVLKGTTTNGFRFNGQGAVKIERGYFRPQKLSQIQLKFKTFSENGLMLLMPGDKNMDFMSIELKDGKVLFQYDLGSGVGSFETQETYNDGRWHTVFANRRNQNGLVKVDNATAANGKSPGNMRDLDVAEELYVGGFRNTIGATHRFEKVTQKGFDGCIQDVYLGGTLKDLNNNLFAIGVVPGCPEIARVVSFRQDVPNGYISMDPVDVDELFQTTLKVKTVESGGLIAYLANDDQSNSLSISMVDGKIVVQTVAGSDKINKVETERDMYNDGRWHYITVRKEGKTLQLNVDDMEGVDTPMKGKKRITTTSPLYFGGYPAGYTIRPGNTATTQRFIGCVGDVTVNGNFINFALAPPESRGGASLARCPLPDLEMSTPTPTLSPTAVTAPAASNLVRSERCALPEEPVTGGVVDDSGGARFGSQPYSRWEFDKAPDAFRVVSNFSLEFKTTERDGVIFYVADNRQTDFIALYMKDGKLVYSFNCGSGPAVLTSTNTFNDGKWHTVVFWRRQWRGRLTVDGVSEAEDRTKGNARSLNISPPFYVGGLAEEEASATAGNLNGVTDGFKGCIQNLQLNELDFGRQDREFYVEPCSDAIETGSFFYADGGYIKLKDNFHVGLDLEVTMDIKPRSHSGVLLSVSSGKEDYFLIQMVDGEIILGANNGGGEVRTSLKPVKSNSLCNGQWHRIRAVKAKNVVTLFVDGVSAYPGIGMAGISSTDTNDPLYVGGLPVSYKGVETNAQYVGCIKGITLNSAPQNLAGGTIYGRVTNTCPTT